MERLNLLEINSLDSFDLCICVLFVLGNTGAEDFIIWVRGTKYVQCDDIACELFLTTDSLNMGKEKTQRPLNTWEEGLLDVGSGA